MISPVEFGVRSPCERLLDPVSQVSGGDWRRGRQWRSFLPRCAASETNNFLKKWT
jgi:hypothetical protein